MRNRESDTAYFPCDLIYLLVAPHQLVKVLDDVIAFFGCAPIQVAHICDDSGGLMTCFMRGHETPPYLVRGFATTNVDQLRRCDIIHDKDFRVGVVERPAASSSRQLGQRRDRDEEPSP